MTDNFNEENKEPEKKSHWTKGNDKTLKFIAVCLCAFLGGFVAVLALGGIMTIPHKNAPMPPHPFDAPAPPMHHRHHHHPAPPAKHAQAPVFLEEDDFFVIPQPKQPVPPHKKVKGIVNIDETPQHYKVFIDLKNFNNDEKNVSVTVKPHLIKISGKAEVKKGKEQSYFSYSQELTLQRKVDVDDVTKEKIGKHYVITLPIEND